MKPELILQSDVLDIVFENKNKEYGAYELRRQYNNRLTKSIAITGLIVILFSALQSLKVQNKKGDFEIPDLKTLKLLDVPVAKEDQPKKELPKRIHKENVSQASVTPPLIVPDAKADHPISDIDKIDSSLIGTTEINGSAASENIGESTRASTGSVGSESGTAVVKDVIDVSPLEKAEIMPQFPGGMEAFLKYLQKNLREPNDIEVEQKFVVIAKFVVDTQGNIADINIIKNGRDDLDAEVLRVVRKMPKWKPGMQNGRNVNVYFNLPVTFVGKE